MTEGLDREVMDQVAAEVEKEIGVHFDLESEDTAAGVCQVKVTAVGTGSMQLTHMWQQCADRTVNLSDQTGFRSMPADGGSEKSSYFNSAW